MKEKKPKCHTMQRCWFFIVMSTESPPPNCALNLLLQYAPTMRKSKDCENTKKEAISHNDLVIGSANSAVLGLVHTRR